MVTEEKTQLLKDVIAVMRFPLSLEAVIWLSCKLVDLIPTVDRADGQSFQEWIQIIVGWRPL